MAKNKSSVIQLLDIVYSASLESTNHSWERLNNALAAALKTAIGGGFKFDIGDWEYIGEHYKSGYWLGDGIERWYSRCVADGNVSAIAAYEAWKGREPFIADDVTPSESELAHMTGDRKSCRLAVGFHFKWKGVKVTVNSFAADGSYINACAYEGMKEDPIPSVKLQKQLDAVKAAGYNSWYSRGDENRNPTKRFKITRQDIIDDRAERKKRAKTWSAIMAYAIDGPRGETLRKWSGAKSQAEVDLLPISKLEEVLEKCRAKWPEPKKEMA